MKHNGRSRRILGCQLEDVSESVREPPDQRDKADTHELVGNIEKHDAKPYSDCGRKGHGSMVQIVHGGDELSKAEHGGRESDDARKST